MLKECFQQWKRHLRKPTKIFKITVNLKSYFIIFSIKLWHTPQCSCDTRPPLIIQQVLHLRFYHFAACLLPPCPHADWKCYSAGGKTSGKEFYLKKLRAIPQEAFKKRVIYHRNQRSNIISQELFGIVDPQKIETWKSCLKNDAARQKTSDLLISVFIALPTLLKRSL